MAEVPRLILMLVLAGVVLTLLGALAIRLNDEARRIRRGLKVVLGAEPHAVIVARGRGRGAGFDFGANRMAVAWDAGAWCLIYRIDELIGAELILDGQVAARAHRGEARRALDVLGGAEKEVRLRLVFDDPRHPEFQLVLWNAADPPRRNAESAEDAVQEANRWIARTEALLRRPLPRRSPSRRAKSPSRSWPKSRRRRTMPSWKRTTPRLGKTTPRRTRTRTTKSRPTATSGSLDGVNTQADSPPWEGA